MSITKDDLDVLVHRLNKEYNITNFLFFRKFTLFSSASYSSTYGLCVSKRFGDNIVVFHEHTYAELYRFIMAKFFPKEFIQDESINYIDRLTTLIEVTEWL